MAAVQWWLGPGPKKLSHGPPYSVVFVALSNKNRPDEIYIPRSGWFKISTLKGKLVTTLPSQEQTKFFIRLSYVMVDPPDPTRWVVYRENNCFWSWSWYLLLEYYMHTQPKPIHLACREIMYFWALRTPFGAPFYEPPHRAPFKNPTRALFGAPHVNPFREPSRSIILLSPLKLFG